mmetsp:Transcript_109145/g.304235  ORF Transcript_109145/g.304235 Transcript_109145/m.304235 type:complete len:401 (+) Transcript_109145:262-1464(+)
MASSPSTAACLVEESLKQPSSATFATAPWKSPSFFRMPDRRQKFMHHITKPRAADPRRIQPSSSTLGFPAKTVTTNTKVSRFLVIMMKPNMAKSPSASANPVNALVAKVKGHCHAERMKKVAMAVGSWYTREQPSMLVKGFRVASLSAVTDPSKVTTRAPTMPSTNPPPAPRVKIFFSMPPSPAPSAMPTLISTMSSRKEKMSSRGFKKPSAMIMPLRSNTLNLDWASSLTWIMMLIPTPSDREKNIAPRHSKMGGSLISTLSLAIFSSISLNCDFQVTPSPYFSFQYLSHLEHLNDMYMPKPPQTMGHSSQSMFICCRACSERQQQASPAGTSITPQVAAAYRQSPVALSRVGSTSLLTPASKRKNVNGACMGSAEPGIQLLAYQLHPAMAGSAPSVSV